MKEIISHALSFNHKKNAQDLNLLDVLNSYDEIISKFYLSSLIMIIENYKLSPD
jgi:hypothetical protein